MATNLKNATTKPSGSKGVPPIVKKPQVARPNKVTRTDVDAVNRAAEGFLQIYYECMDGPLRDANIVKLYRDVSTMIWNGEVVTGAEKIKDFLAKMPESKHEIQSWDCHPIPGYNPAPILITVSGTVIHGSVPPKMPQTKKHGHLPRIFSQTFVLAPEPNPPQAEGTTSEGDTFYIRSDTMRFVG